MKGSGLSGPRGTRRTTRAPVINGSQDRLFSLDGVHAAFDKIGRCYAKAAAADCARCQLYDAPHEFNLEMQTEAWEWLGRWS